MEEFLIQILKRNTSQPLTTGEQKNSFSFFDLGSYIITSISNDAHKNRSYQTILMQVCKTLEQLSSQACWV